MVEQAVAQDDILCGDASGGVRPFVFLEIAQLHGVAAHDGVQRLARLADGLGPGGGAAGGSGDAAVGDGLGVAAVEADGVIGHAEGFGGDHAVGGAHPLAVFCQGAVNGGGAVLI